MWINKLKFPLLLTIFTIPLIPAHLGFGYELIKVVFFLSLTIFTGLIYLYRPPRHNSFNGRSINCDIQWTKIKLASLIFLIILTLTSVIGIHPFDSLVGKYPYYQGLILYWFLFLFYLMISEAGIGLKALSKVITLSALIVAIIAIFQFLLLNLFKIEIPTYAGRVVSTFGQPNLYSGFLLLSLPFAYQLKKGRFFWISIISLGIVLSMSKAAVILLLAIGLYIFFKNFSSKGWTIFLVVTFLVNALTFSLDKSTGLVWDELVRPLTKQGTEGYLVEKRIYIIPVILDIYSKSPILGYGIDSINNLYKEHFANFKPELKNYPPLYFNLMNLTIDRSHNYFLDLLVFSGISGFVSYLYLVYLVFKKPAPNYLKVVLLLYLIWVEFQVQSIVHLMLFWLIVGVVDNVRKLKDDKL